MPTNDIVTVRLDGFTAIAKRMPSALQLGCNAIALSIVQKAKYNVVQQDAVDTGALLNSIYLETPESSGREEAVTAAVAAAATDGQHSGRPHAFVESIPAEITGVRIWAKVGVAAEYGSAVETGTKRGMAARPYLTPASDDVQKRATSIMVAVINQELKKP